MLTVHVSPPPGCPALFVLILILWEEVGILPAPSSANGLAMLVKKMTPSHWIKFAQPQASTLTYGIPISYFCRDGDHCLETRCLTMFCRTLSGEFFAVVIVPNVLLILWGILAEVTNDSMIYVIMERLFGAASFASDWDCGFGIKWNLLFSNNFILFYVFFRVCSWKFESTSSHLCLCAQQEVSSYSNIIYLPSSCILLPAVTAHKCLRFVWTSFALKSNV